MLKCCFFYSQVITAHFRIFDKNNICWCMKLIGIIVTITGLIAAHLIAQYIGTKRKIGYGKSVFWSIVLTPLIGLVITLSSKKLDKSNPDNWKHRLLKKETNQPPFLTIFSVVFLSNTHFRWITFSKICLKFSIKLD